MRKVVVVDDDKLFLQELKETLLLSGYETIEANDPLSGIQTVLRERPDVAVLDISMPIKSGMEVARDLKQDVDIPMIAMSGLYTELTPELKACGFRKFLKKPVKPLDIIAAIEELLPR